MKQEARLLQISAMIKLAEFALNYDHRFIENAFPDKPNMWEHWNSKFSDYYKKATPYGALIALIASMSTDNKEQLMSYILNK